MDISLTKILNEITEEILEDKKVSSLNESEEVSPEEVQTAVESSNNQTSPEVSSEEQLSPEDEALMAKLAQVFSPEEATLLAQKLESGEISDEDIIAHLASLENSEVPVAESVEVTLPVALAIGAGALLYNK